MIKLFLLVIFLKGCFCNPFEEKLHEEYEEKFITQYIDHFNYLGSAGANGQYQMRYLISKKYWNGVGPIFFYTGNEGSILSFWDNSGFVFELAKKFSGLILFGEHRYYGKSLPFGNDSFSKENIGFLSIEQALADYAVLVKYVKKEYNAGNSSVFALGGSYGGLLTGYMRYKYPHIISGGVASSAPFYTIAGKRPRGEFWTAVTNTFDKADPNCKASVQKGFNQLMDLFAGGTEERLKIEQIFNLCPGQMTKKYLEKNVIAWLRNSFTMLAMMDYPYPAKFMADLPGNPVNVACSYMKPGSEIEGLAKIANLLYGTSVACHDTYKEYVACSDPTGCGVGPDNPPWDYQACTEMILPGGSNNKTDMFPPLDFTLDMRRHYCSSRFGLGYSRLDWVATNYFGSPDDVKKASRIIFPNGDLDPWMPGGVLKSLSDSLIAIIIEGGAHHLDLRGSNPKDPQSVIDARNKITDILAQWLEEDTKKK